MSFSTFIAKASRMLTHALSLECWGPAKLLGLLRPRITYLRPINSPILPQHILGPVLPSDILGHLIFYLEPQDIFALAQVNWIWNKRLRATPIYSGLLAAKNAPRSEIEYAVSVGNPALVEYIIIYNIQGDMRHYYFDRDLNNVGLAVYYSLLYDTYEKLHSVLSKHGAAHIVEKYTDKCLDMCISGRCSEIYYYPLTMRNPAFNGQLGAIMARFKWLSKQYKIARVEVLWAAARANNIDVLERAASIKHVTEDARELGLYKWRAGIANVVPAAIEIIANDEMVVRRFVMDAVKNDSARALDWLKMINPGFMKLLDDGAKTRLVKKITRNSKAYMAGWFYANDDEMAQEIIETIREDIDSNLTIEDRCLPMLIDWAPKMMMVAQPGIPWYLIYYNPVHVGPDGNGVSGLMNACWRLSIKNKQLNNVLLEGDITKKINQAFIDGDIGLLEFYKMNSEEFTGQKTGIHFWFTQEIACKEMKINKDYSSLDWWNYNTKLSWTNRYCFYHSYEMFMGTINLSCEMFGANHRLCAWMLYVNIGCLVALSLAY